MWRRSCDRNLCDRLEYASSPRLGTYSSAANWARRRLSVLATTITIMLIDGQVHTDRVR